jgi:hypothetical protein
MARGLGATVGDPLTAAWGNVAYARSLTDAWAVFELPTVAYPEQPLEHRATVVAALADLVRDLGADYKIDVCAAGWSPDAYAADRLTGAPARHQAARRTYVEAQAEALGNYAFAFPRTFLSVCLDGAAQDRSEVLSDAITAAVSDPASWLRTMRERWTAARPRLGMATRDDLSQRRLQDDQCRALELGYRLGAAWPDIKPATTATIRWLIARSWARGLGEPNVPPAEDPGALDFQLDGGAVLEPLGGQVLEWMDYVHRRGWFLEVESETGVALQTGLAATQLPAGGHAPDALLELLFRPAQRLAFPIDVALTVQWVSNARALRAAQDKVDQADEQADDEHDSRRGVDDDTDERTQLSRDYVTYLRRSGDPMHQAQLTVMFGSPPDLQLHRQRGDEVKAAFKAHGATMRTPVAQQQELFAQHLPAQRFHLRGYRRHLTGGQVGAMAPTARHRVGSGRGWLLGRLLHSAIAPPVLLDLAEGSHSDRAGGIVFIADSGAGKTTATGKLCLEAFLDGARIFDSDVKGDDHHWLEHSAVAEHVDHITLAPDPSLRGMLDPWVNAPRELRMEAAQDFLYSLFPRNVQAAWEQALLEALAAVNRLRAPSNVEVIRALQHLSAPDDLQTAGVALARHLQRHAEHGLPQLGFADPATSPRVIGHRQVTHVLLGNLPLPDATVKPDTYRPSQRIAEQIHLLMTLLATRLGDENPDELVIYNDDEGWRALRTNVGRQAADARNRIARSKAWVPMYGLQFADDIGPDTIGNLFGARFIGRLPDQAQRAHAIRLIGRDPADEQLHGDLARLSPGQFLLQDHFDQVDFIQIDRGPIADLLSTTRRRRGQPPPADPAS